jgi:hypothetical protein
MGIVESLKILLTGDASGLEKEMKKAERSLKKLERDFNDLAQVSALTGAAIVGFGALMVKEAAKYDGAVAGAVKSLQGAYSALAVEVAQALLPVLKVLADAFKTMVAWIQSLSPATKKFVAVVASLAAAIGLLGGASSSLIATALKLAPILLPIAPMLLGIVAVIGAIVVAVALWRKAWEVNLGGIREKTQKAVTFLKALWSTFFGNQIKMAVQAGVMLTKLILHPLQSILRQMRAVASIVPGMGDFVEPLTQAIKGIDTILDGGVKEILSGAKDVGDAVVDGLKLLFKDMMGALSEGADKMRGVITSRPGLIEQNRSVHERNVAGLHRAEGLNWLSDLEMAKMSTRYGLGRGRMSGASSATGQMPELGPTLREAWKAAGGWKSAVVDATDAVKKFGGAARGVLDRIGGIAAVGGSALDKLQDGDLWGAIAGVIADLLTAAGNFEGLINVAMGALKAAAKNLEFLVRTLRPFIAAVGLVVETAANNLKPVFDAVGQVFADLAPQLRVMAVSFVTMAPLFRALSLVLKIFGPILELHFQLMRGVTMVILTIVTEAAKIFNSVLGALNAFGVFDGLIAEVNQFIAENQAAVDELNNMTFSSAKAANDELAARYENIAVMEEQSKTIREVSEELSNVPAGYKVNAARFRADGAMFNPNIIKDHAETSNITVNTVVMVGGKEVAAEVEKQIIYRNFQRTGAKLTPWRK